MLYYSVLPAINHTSVTSLTLCVECGTPVIDTCVLCSSKAIRASQTTQVVRQIQPESLNVLYKE